MSFKWWSRIFRIWNKQKSRLFSPLMNKMWFDNSCVECNKKIVQNNEVVTFSQWMVIRLNDEEGGMKDHQTIIIIYSQLLKLSRVKSNFHFWRPPQCSAGDANLPLPNFPGREKKNYIHSFICSCYICQTRSKNTNLFSATNDFVSMLWNIFCMNLGFNCPCT